MSLNTCVLIGLGIFLMYLRFVWEVNCNLQRWQASCVDWEWLCPASLRHLGLCQCFWMSRIGDCFISATLYFMCLSQPSRISLTYLLMSATRGQLGCPVLIYWPYLNVAGSVIILCSHLQGDWPCCVAEMWYFLSSVSGTNKALVLFVALLPLFMSCFLSSVAKTLLHTLQPHGSALLWNNLHAHPSALHPSTNILIVAPWAGLVGWHKAVGSGYSLGTKTASIPLREADYRELSKQEASARDKII